MRGGFVISKVLIFHLWLKLVHQSVKKYIYLYKVKEKKDSETIVRIKYSPDKEYYS